MERVGAVQAHIRSSRWHTGRRGHAVGHASLLEGTRVAERNQNFEWEPWVIEKVLPHFEERLVSAAINIRDEAVALLEEYRARENNGALNLGIVVRVRADTLGPRITWVRFRGKPRRGRDGKTFSPTEPIKLHGRYRYSSRIFAPFPVDIRKRLEKLEDSAAYVRFRTDRLAELARLARASARPR